MKTTTLWLERYLENIDYEAISKLDCKGFPVDSIYSPNPHLKPLTIVRIAQIKPHPNKDDVNLVTVTYQHQSDSVVKTVVCGDQSLKINDHAVLVQVGQIVPSTGKNLKERAIAGVISDGMLCSGEELGLKPTAGVLVLENSANCIEQALFPAGSVYDIEITYNRGDLLSTKGVARELAALGYAQLKKCVSEKYEYINSTNISIQTTQCSAYSLAYFNYKQIKPNADHSTNKFLHAIHSDITAHTAVNLANFIMHDMGQPMHIFDSDKINGKICIRNSIKGEKFTDLHAKEHILPSDLLVVADETGILAVAGVIGGLKAACSLTTTNIAIEIAHFDADAVLKSKLALNINTKAAAFFTHKVDMKQMYDSLTMFEDLSGLKAEKIEYAGDCLKESESVIFDMNLGKQLCGDYFTQPDFVKIMNALGFEVEQLDDHVCKITIPSHRQDIDCPQVLLSEYMRYVGYDKVQNNQTLQTENQKTAIVMKRDFIALLSAKYHEAKNFTLIDQADHLINPMPGYNGLRSTILPTLLENMIRNFSKNHTFNGMFERGLVFEGDQDNIIEQNKLALISIESMGDLQTTLIKVLSMLGIDKIAYDSTENELFKQGWSGSIVAQGKCIGIIGNLKHSLKTKVEFVGFELNLDKIHTLKTKRSNCYKPCHIIYHRDLSVAVKDATAASLIKKLQQEFPKFTFKIISYYPTSLIQARKIGVRCFIRAERAFVFDELEQITRQLECYANELSL